MRYLLKEKKLSERQACKLVGISRRVYRYSKCEEESEIREQLRELAFTHRRAGYRMLHRKLRMKGIKVNHKKVYRLYKEENLVLHRRRKKKIPSHLRIALPEPKQQNICWSMDFVSDVVQDGRALPSFEVSITPV